MSAGAVVLAGGLVGCAGDERDEVVVAAAASLTEAFTELGAAYEAARPDVAVTFNFAASSELAAQLIEGAPVDVFASADDVNMARVVDPGLTVGAPVVFATNRLEIVVEPGNPLGITGLADLADRDLLVVLCAPEVPCGRYAGDALGQAGVDVEPASFEENVKAVVSKVALGEADAGIAYATDVAATDAVDGVPIADEVDVVAEYPIAVAVEADVERGRDFVGFVVGETGRTILADHGFGVP